MSLASGLMPVNANEVSVGQVISWPIYDEYGHLMLQAGSTIADEIQLRDILEHGYCNPEEMWDAIPSKADISEKVRQTLSQQAEQHKEVSIEMDSVRWYVGETFYLQLTDNMATRYTVKLIGYVKNQSILVTAPLVDGKPVHIRDNQSFIVRTFPGKKAYAFTSSCLKSIYAPHSYLHLSYPKMVRCTTIRQGARANVKIIASVTLGADQDTAATVLSDLSMGGAAGVIKRPLGKKGDTGVIKFKVNAAGMDEYLVINVVLRSVTPSETGAEYRHGFEFIDVTAHYKLILSAFVHQTLAEID